MNILKRLWAFLTRRQLVWLVDYDGEHTLSVAYRMPWGEVRAKRWWPWEIGKVVLNPDGTTYGTSYVNFWKKV